jgi:hypothetical protein
MKERCQIATQRFSYSVVSDFEGLAESLLEDGLNMASKYRTLPAKRVTQQIKTEKVLPLVSRPASTAGKELTPIEYLLLF